MAQPVILLSAERRDLVTLGVAVNATPSGELPCEVRIFRAGANATEKGDFLFDDIAARSVIDHYNAHGVRIMIDLEHLSLDEECANYDPDPRAWCSLEIRAAEAPEAGAAWDLWITKIEWLDDGVRRLTGKLQPYLSPAFPADEDRRIRFVRNIALTAMPATHFAPALVAASSKGKTMDLKTLIALLAQLTPTHALSARALNVLLAAAEGEPPPEGGEAPAGKWATVVRTAQAAADALKGVQKVKDPDEAMALAQAAQKAVDDFEKAFAALTGGSQDDAAGEAAATPPPAEASARSGDQSGSEQAMRAKDRELERLRAVAVEHEAMLAKQAAERIVIENGERRRLVGKLVELGHELPATAWADDAATTPAEPWASMPLVQLRARVERLTGIKIPARDGVQPPTGGAAVATTNHVNMSEFEINRLRATHDRENRHVPERQRRPVEQCIELLASTKARQLAGAEAKGDRALCQRLSRPVQESDVLTRANREMVKLASVGVVPIAQMGPSSQRALEEFRIEFNSTLVSQPIPWAEDLGVVLPGGSLKDTYPLAFYAIKYREQLAENPAAVTPNSRDVTVTKKLFSAAATAELIRIVKGDFAYIQTWQQTAANMARARVFLRNQLITTLLEAGHTGYWGQTADQATGIDGQPFFSASHKVNPFDPKMTMLGATTWSNLTATGGTAKPLNATNLTAVKAAMLLVPGPDGELLNTRATGMLVPVVLDEAARLLLTVQDLILGDKTTGDGGVTNVMGQVRNEHYMSGFEYVTGAQLAGSGATANYYTFSRETFARGLPPWVLAEDAAEEVRVWDENSDFYKNSGFIKTGSYVYCNAALLYPHGIRKVYGA